MTLTQPTVYLVDDDPAICKMIRVILSSVALPCRTFGTANAFLEAFESGWHGCLILDIRMPRVDGMQLLQMLPERDIRLPVIVLTGYGDVSTAVQAMKSGVVDFLEKPVRPQLLLQAVNRALALDRDYRARCAEAAEFAGRRQLLTPRESEVMDLIVSGDEPKTIAQKLGISRKTLDVHRHQVMKKMQVATVADLVRQSLNSPGRSIQISVMKSTTIENRSA